MSLKSDMVSMSKCNLCSSLCIFCSCVKGSFMGEEESVSEIRVPYSTVVMSINLYVTSGTILKFD
jgi:hypothetical protein